MRETTTMQFNIFNKRKQDTDENNVRLRREGLK